MKKKIILSIIIIFFSVGGFFLYQAFNSEVNLINASKNSDEYSTEKPLVEENLFDAIKNSKKYSTEPLEEDNLFAGTVSLMAKEEENHQLATLSEDEIQAFIAIFKDTKGNKVSEELPVTGVHMISLENENSTFNKDLNLFVRVYKKEDKLLLSTSAGKYEVEDMSLYNKFISILGEPPSE